MVSKNIIQVFEHEKLTLHSNVKFEKKHLTALITFNERNDNKYFKLIRDGVKFTQYVGVLKAGNLTIEILPKADKKIGGKQLWRNILLDMLKECKFLKIDHVDKAQLNLRSNSLLEIYIQLFLAEVEQIVREGLLKKYVPEEGNKNALKGRLNFSKNITKNIVHREKFYVNYIEYSPINIFNQIILKTLLMIPKISNSHFFNDRVQRLLLDLPEMSESKITSLTFEKLVYDRKTERYKEALLISRILLLNFRPDISGGAENVIAILFDMNKLWEEFVFRRLKREERAFDISVDRQQWSNFWNTDLLSNPKTIRPDLIIKAKNPCRTIVIDTKWKIVDDLIPDDEDLKQMFIYNLYWNCDRSILLYPSSSSFINHGEYNSHGVTKFLKVSEQLPFISKCSVQTVSILNKENHLDKEFGKNILKEIL